MNTLVTSANNMSFNRLDSFVDVIIYVKSEREMYGDGTHQESFDQEVFHYSANGGHKIFNILPSV